ESPSPIFYLTHAPTTSSYPLSYTTLCRSAVAWGDGLPATPGSTTSQTNPITATHTYALPGTYTVTVTVTDKDGGAGSGQLTVTSADAPKPPPPAPFDVVCPGPLRAAMSLA